jgi:hypothetical protein
MDKNSSNGTWKGKLKLKTNVHYALEAGDELKCGNIVFEFRTSRSSSPARDNDEKQQKFETMVPETPITNKKSSTVSAGWVVPESQSSPAVLPRTSKKAPPSIPDSPFGANDSSFLAPSQPLSKSKPSPILSR